MFIETNMPPSALEDPTQPPHYRPDMVIPELEPYTVLLKDGQTTATIYPISSTDQLPVGLLAFLCDEFNAEIERGDTYPLFDTLHIDTFQNYWFGSFAGVMLIGDAPVLEERRQWEKECLGTFYVKPNYPGRCAHICTGGFLVNAGIRRKGIGRTLAECYLEWAPKLGYTYSVFNLVFETNLAARRIWETLGFKRIGRIKGAGILRGHEHAIDALMYGRELVEPSEEAVGELRFDKIKYYLETGRYPPQSDRQEKSRLRSSAAHYKLRDGRLMLKDREVVPDTDRQMQIATEIHLQNHAGINKTTSQITEKYHWTRIKETVAAAIRNCSECRESSRPPPKRARKNGDYSDDEEMSDSLLNHTPPQHGPPPPHHHHQYHAPPPHHQQQQHHHPHPLHPHHPNTSHQHGPLPPPVSSTHSDASAATSSNHPLRHHHHDTSSMPRGVNAAMAAVPNEDSLLTSDLNLDADVDDPNLMATLAAAQHNQHTTTQPKQEPESSPHQHHRQLAEHNSHNNSTTAGNNHSNANSGNNNEKTSTIGALLEDNTAGNASNNNNNSNQDSSNKTNNNDKGATTNASTSANANINNNDDTGDTSSNQAGGENTNNQYFQQERNDNRSNEDIPVDPQVESAFEEHVHGGEEIEIARALIQANESSVDQDDNNNIFQ